jgi:pimeloyl-ACP methyl ester carboxylesterase
LLSPFLHTKAATYRPGSGGWVGVGLPRVVALALLNRIGITFLDDLPVVAFALGPREREFLTPSYSYALAANFRPHDDYRGDIRGARQPLAVLVGEQDEVFRPDKFAGVFAEAGRPTPVTIVPGVNHIGLTVQAAGIEAIVSAVEGLRRR